MRKAISHLKKSDPILSAIIERVGPCKIAYGEPTFPSLAEAIVYQQLNGKAAVTIFNRFADLAGRPLTPRGILKLTEPEMRSAGLSKQKLVYIRSLAELTEMKAAKKVAVKKTATKKATAKKSAAKTTKKGAKKK